MKFRFNYTNVLISQQQIKKYHFVFFSYIQLIIKLYRLLSLIQRNLMNFSAKLKTNQNPNYVFNFNIDLPIKYKSSFTHRSNQTSPSKSPGKLNQKKYKLSSITPRPVANVSNVKKAQKSNTKSNKKATKIPKTMKQQFLQKDLYQINNFNFFQQQKKPQPSISRKTQKIVSNRKNSQKQQICPSRRTIKNSGINNNSETLSRKNVVRNISILEKLVTDDHIIKYTTDSSEIKQTEPSSNIQINNFLFKYAKKEKSQEINDKASRLGTSNDQFNIDQIRQFEQIATQRKQKLNYEYLRQKILVQASVKKIQRAWRKYMTKKLVTSYSTTISNKLVNNYVINSARSQPRCITFHKNKKLFKSNQLYGGNQKINQIINFQKKRENQELQSQSSSEQQQKLQNNKLNRSGFQKNNAFKNGKVQKSFFGQQKNKKQNQKQISQRSISQASSSSKNIRLQQNHLDFLQEQIIVLSKSNPSSSMNKSSNQMISSGEKPQQLFIHRQIQQKLKKFQQEQIRKWQSILDSIKKGKNIEVLLQKSQKYKKQLQNNLKLIKISSIDKNRASPIIFQHSSKKQAFIKENSFSEEYDLSKSYLNKMEKMNDKITQFYQKQEQKSIDKQRSRDNIKQLIPQNLLNQENQNNIKTIQHKIDAKKHESQPISFIKQQKTLIQKQAKVYKQRQQIKKQRQLLKLKKQKKQQELNQTAQKRKQKILFFQNQILKIDNQDYSDISSVSCQSFNNLYNIESENLYKNNKSNSGNSNWFNDLEQRERQENLKLRKKLQLFNTHFLDISSEEGLTDRSLKGLKGNSTDERRNTINKRMNKFNDQDAKIQIEQHRQEPPSSEEGRKYRRQDITVLIDENKKGKPILNHLQNLINKRIQYDEQQEGQEYQQESRNLKQAQQNFEEEEEQQNSLKRQKQNYHVDSQNQSEQEQYSEQIELIGHQKHFNDDYIYAEPVLTHRDRKLQVPQLNLESLTKNVTNLFKNHQKSQERCNVKRSTKQDEIQIKNQTNKQTQQKKKRNEVQLQNKQTQKNDKNKLKKQIPKADMKDVLKICGYLQQQLVYQSLLQFSDSDQIVQSIKGLFDSYKKDKKKVKPQGICTNLQSIKDYLQNFVGYIFQNKLSQQIQTALWTASGPKVTDLLQYLRRDSNYQSDQNQYIMNISIFQKHWKYANSNIYFDKKYNDEKTQTERVVYLKGLTRVYFRSIFDAFNQSLEFQRIYGLMGYPYPWCKRIAREQKKTLKTAFQQAYRRILKISVVYYGVHFDDKSHLFNQQSIKQLQQQRLLTLLMMQLEQDQYRWNFIEDQLAQVKYDVGLMIQQLILQEFLSQFKGILAKQKQQ